MKKENSEILKNMTVLWIEDDKSLRGLIERMLVPLCQKLDVATDGEQALAFITVNKYDIVFVDIDVPKVNGLDVLEVMRKKDVITPVVMVSGKSDRDTLFRSANLKIQNYITKPFTYDKIIDALDLAIESTKTSKPKLLEFPNGCVYSISKKEVTCGDRIDTLTKNEHLLLDFLIDRRGHVCSYDEIYDTVWGFGSEPKSESSIKTLVYSLRKKIGKDSIKNHSGIGFSLVTAI